MRNETREYRVFGNVAGRIWLPAAECWKPFDSGWFTFTDDDTYNPPKNGFHGTYPDWRTALLDVTNDGDFQSCSIVHAVVQIRDTEGRKVVTRTFQLNGLDDNADLWHSPEERERLECDIMSTHSET